jgi:choline kinase
LHSDLIYTPQLLQQIIAYKSPNVLLVERKSCNEEDMKVKVEAGVLIESNKEIPISESFGEWTGIAKFSSQFAEVLSGQIDILLKQGHEKAYDTLAFTQLAQQGHAISIAQFIDLPWMEIDTLDDLKQARALFGG